MEGPTSWVKQRRFSGPRAERRKRRLVLQESVRTLTLGALAVMVILFSTANFKPENAFKVAECKAGPVRTKVFRGEMPSKQPSTAVNIT